jgi:hypothetical protein
MILALIKRSLDDQTRRAPRSPYLALAGLLLGGCAAYDIGDLWHGSGGSSSAGSGSGGGPAECWVDGAPHAAGDSFPSADGCNQCFCDEGGGVACTERACLNECGGLLGLSCPEEQFCSFSESAQCGAADQTGVCAPRPEICTFQYDPVCGCDGQTYGNACGAASAGVSVASAGECGAEPTCSVDDDCPVPPCACLDEDGDGVCENQCPTAACIDGQCTLVDPGSQGQIGDSCGGFRLPNTGLCSNGLFCQHQPGALCGAADAPGVCVDIPEVCADIFAPVCGCDGETYANACQATAAQVGIFETGECQ